ncbi:scyllo-inositol 2-dehydrogenase (NAD(+)) [Pontiella desulfatans]|uniref:Scyllo-inositol 2-dehydrogenase (NAD(+)) n=1 Tax=Pontiella desulfatans TaxID=2750659 RepID=A0A6C2U4F9_PONDE|nr:Gfo/Idh/MocA family oxidoreductase [Pontiella desulfatans]VGO14932.1 scyllo-inositol 2-dehydrogenase (NAD(+)) [Pontiella desulfatans]
MKNSTSFSRKHFLVASAGVAAAPLILPSGVYGAEQELEIGLIGCGRMGRGNIMSVFGQGKKYNAVITAVCDVDLKRARAMAEELEKKYAEQGRTVHLQVWQDFREFVAKSGVNAVVIATPDHNHAINAIACAEAGMDIYLQKPLTYSVVEGQKLIEVVRRKKVILQVGAQQRSSIYFRKPAELVRNGALGKLHTIEVEVPTDNGTGDPSQSPVPGNLDYDLWIGPTPLQPYAERRVHPQHDLSRPGWLQIEAYCRGMITGWGSHMYDIAQWALDMDGSGPVEVSAKGDFPQRGLFDVHVGYSGEATYANGVKVVSRNGKPGVKFIGEDGWIRCWRGGFEAHDREIFRQEIPESGKLYESKHHEADWLQAIQSRKDPVSTVEIGHRSNTVCVLHHISMKLDGRKLKWDPVKEQITGDPEANALLDFEHRKPWTV